MLMYGTNFKMYEKYFPERTYNQIQYKYHNTINKKREQENIYGLEAMNLICFRASKETSQPLDVAMAIKFGAFDVDEKQLLSQVVEYLVK